MFQDYLKRKSILIVVSIFFIAAGCSSSEPEKIEATSRVETVNSADSVQIAYEVHGDGDIALVLVHCWCCDRGYWQKQIDEFSKDYKLVALDLAGHGESGMQRENYTIEAFANDVLAVIESENLENLILVGHSMGGSVIIEAALKLEGKVKALIGVDCYSGLGQKFSEEQIAGFLEPFKQDFEATTRAFVSPMFSATADTSLKNYIVNDMASSPDEVGVEAFENLFSYLYTGNILDRIKQLNLPMYLIDSDKNPYHAESIKEIVPKYGIKNVKESGHFLQLERPVRFNKAFKETLIEILGSEEE